MNEAQAAAMSRNPRVKLVEENATYTLASSHTGMLTLLAPGKIASRWNLDRMDQPSPSAPRLNDTFDECYNGSGVRAYIVDTGVYPDHPEFAGRVDPAHALKAFLLANGVTTNYLQNCWDFGVLEPTRLHPTANHGTSVASIVGGEKFGVAKGVTLVDAKGEDCRGKSTAMHLVKVLDWITRFDRARGPNSVINISISQEVYQPDWSTADTTALANAIATTVAAPYNIPVVVSAGNFNSNTFWYSPANATRAITVAGTNKDDDLRWAYSNYGNTTVFYAPAQYVESASLKIPAFGYEREFFRSELPCCEGRNPERCPDYPDPPPPDTCTSGTSFSAPYVTGMVARYLQTHPGANRNAIVAAFQSMSTTNSGVLVYEAATGASLPLAVYRDCP